MDRMLGILKVKMSLEYPTFETAFKSGLAAMHVRLANGENLNSLGQVSGLVTCGKLHARVSFIVLDLAFDVVFGLPWLVATNPHLDWA